VKSVIPLEVTLQVEILPEIQVDLKKVKKIKVEKNKVSVSAADVKKDMDEIESKSTGYEAAKKTATVKKDDKLTIHAHGYDKKGGTKDDRLHLHDFSFVIGAGTMIPGFDDHFMGKKVGDKVAFEITFPKDYHSEDFAGQTRYFDCDIEVIENPKKPEWTSEFIEQVWGKKIELDEFKKELKAAILQDRETAEQQRVEDAIYDELIKLSKIEIGPKILARETEQVWQQHSQDLQRKGMEAKAYLDHIGTSEEDFKKAQLEPLALRRLQAQLILENLRNNMEGVEVSDEEIESETKEMFKQYADNKDFLEKVKEMYKPGNDQFEELRSRLQYKKIIEGFIKESTPKKGSK